ncbi:FtsX-like permease family protein [Micromonospora sp. RTGN7]|uniref:FtsX-like permease family protein n=1 Tax=Micromonospora sp. RTGN7 TaxID=3016526 RepID=UPI0029FF3682|nr:FtsX-like permease family protein [Micromonospora sp. RTGN7]
MTGAARRVRAFGGQFLLLGALALVAVLLVTGVPRVADRLTQQGLREYVGGRPAVERDLTFDTVEGLVDQSRGPATTTRARDLDVLQARMPAKVRDAVESRWYVADTALGRLTGADLAAKNLLVVSRLRAMSGIKEAATLIEGRWPVKPTAKGQPIEVVLAADSARKLNLRAGSRLNWADGGGTTRLPVLVVGVFQPARATDGIWDTLPPVLRVTEPVGDAEPYEMVAVTSDGGLDAAVGAGVLARFSWRYRLTGDGMAVADLRQVIDGLRLLVREHQGNLSVTQAVDIPLQQFLDAVSAARTLLAVIAAGVFATLAGLMGLAARLAARRRESEFSLLVARGGAATSAAQRSLAESVLVVPPAAALGWLLGRLLPGVGGGTDWLALATAVLATLALPSAALAVSAVPVGRRDLLRVRAGGRRLTLELLVVALAVLATVLLRRRGLSPGSVDPLLVSVPVLLAVAAAVLALRLYPWPLRLLGRVAARMRGSVTFLGAARASRAAATGPVVVVVVAIATAAFCAVVAAGIETGRDRTASTAVPGSALVDGERLAPETGAALRGLPGVRRATPILRDTALRIAHPRGADAGISSVSVLLVDGPGLAETAKDAGLAVSVPSQLRGGPVPGPVPALVSPALAADLARKGLDESALVTVQGRGYAFRVAGTADGFPLVPPTTDRFVVLPWQALPDAGPTGPVPTAFLVSGDGFDVAELRQAGIEGQHRYQTGGSIVAGERSRGAEVTTWRGARDSLGGGGANGLLVFGFVAGAAGGAALGLLAIAFAVLAGARARGQVLSRLRTLGLSRRQWRGLLLVELAPLVAVALLTGAVTGALLPLLLNPALGLAAFTGGTPVQVAFSPGLVGAVIAVGAVALALAVTVETLNNRRLRLGEVLRLGEES